MGLLYQKNDNIVTLETYYTKLLSKMVLHYITSNIRKDCPKNSKGSEQLNIHTYVQILAYLPFVLNIMV